MVLVSVVLSQIHRKVVLGICSSFVCALLAFPALPGRAAADDFKFPQDIAQDLDTVFSALINSDWPKGRQLADTMITNYEQRLPTVSDEIYGRYLLNGLHAAFLLSAISRYNTRDYGSLTDVLIKRHELRKFSVSAKTPVVNAIYEIEFELNSFLIAVLDENLDLAKSHLDKAREIGDNFPSEQKGNYIDQFNYFRMLTSSAAYLYIQETGSPLPGEEWLAPQQQAALFDADRTLFGLNELMRSVALARIGDINSAMGILEKVGAEFENDDGISTFLVFHKGCLLATVGDRTNAVSLLKDAEQRAKNVGLFLPVSTMFSSSELEDANSNWPPALSPDSDSYLLKIIPAFELGVDFDFATYGDKKLPSSFQSRFGPAISMNFSS